MIKSMTAYARAQQSNEFGDIIIELRSVNHRYLETSFKIPEDFRSQEAEFRKLISKTVKRGKMDILLRYKVNPQHSNNLEIEPSKVESLRQAQDSINQIILEAKALSVAEILNWPGTINDNKTELSQFFKLAKNTLDIALKDFINGREKEGQALKQMLVIRCQQMSEIVIQIENNRPQVVKDIETKWRNTFKEKLEQWSDSLDSGRLEQELLLIAQKLDIDEEIDRLKIHLIEVQDVLERDEAVGRRLDFLMQELNREANTLSSKSQDSTTTQQAVDLKVLIEQMREQVQNIE